MRHSWLTKMTGALAVLVLVGTTACVTREDDVDDTPVKKPDASTTKPDGGTNETPGNGASVQGAIAGYSKGQAISVENAVVVAEHHFLSNGATVGTFYIQDQNKTGPGLAVYHSSKDSAPYPSVGDVVNVSGWLNRFNGSLQISSSTKYSTSLAVTVVSSGNGKAAGGAMPPAGTPISASGASEYAGSIADNHADQVGNVVYFAGPLQVTNSKAIVATDADGGTKPAGFELTGGLRVYDTQVYYDCIRTLDGGVGALDFSKGIRGVWERYQDFNAGSAQDPAPRQPVLVPMNCDDLKPQQ